MDSRQPHLGLLPAPPLSEGKWAGPSLTNSSPVQRDTLSFRPRERGGKAGTQGKLVRKPSSIFHPFIRQIFIERFLARHPPRRGEDGSEHNRFPELRLTREPRREENAGIPKPVLHHTCLKVTGLRLTFCSDRELALPRAEAGSWPSRCPGRGPCRAPARLTSPGRIRRPGRQGRPRCSYVRLGGKFLLVLSAAWDQRTQVGSTLTCPSSGSGSPRHQEHPASLPSRGPEAQGPQHKPRAPLLSCWPLPLGLPDLSNLPGQKGSSLGTEKRVLEEPPGP